MARDASGEDGLSLADRVELGLARGYWEENLVLGRRAALDRLVESMQPLAGRRVLDPCCGLGSAARLVRQAGGLVVACAPTARAASRACRRSRDGGGGAELTIVAAAEPFDIFGPRAFDDVLLIEPGFLANPAQSEAWLEGLDRLEAERVFLLLRVPTRWAGLARGGDRESLPELDFTAALREIHLATAYRLERSAEERRRNSALRLAVLARPRA